MINFGVVIITEGRGTEGGDVCGGDGVITGGDGKVSAEEGVCSPALLSPSIALELLLPLLLFLELFP